MMRALVAPLYGFLLAAPLIVVYYSFSPGVVLEFPPQPPVKYEPMLEGLYQRALTRSVDEPAYQERRRASLTLRDHVMKLMADHRLDALVYPHQKRLVVPIGEDQVDRNGVLGAITGFPAITVPGGFSPKTASAPLGVPIGVEFLGRPFSEPILIRLASAFEHETRHRRAPASTPPRAQQEP